jgi:hypothetical protein
MPVNASTNRYSYDAATAFRAYGSAAIVVDGATDALPVDKGTAYWDTSIMTSQEFAVVIDVTAITTTLSTYKLAVEFDDDGTFGSGNTVTELQISPAAVGTYVIHVPRERIPTNSKFMRVNVDITTTGSPSITFAAWAAPIVG